MDFRIIANFAIFKLLVNFYNTVNALSIFPTRSYNFVYMRLKVVQNAMHNFFCTFLLLSPSNWVPFG